MKNRDDVAARSEGTLKRDRWKAINQIFHAALELPPSLRREFIAEASNSDRDLEAEVELLLKADEDAGSYIESPLLPINLFTAYSTGLRPGDELCGRFRIVRAVGEGGMGQVFEAFDAELGVQLALKVIRPEIASNAEALARFRQEVRLARRITHPNVCRTFDLERDSRGVDAESGAKREFIFLTMEFLEGESLAARIKREGALPLDEALALARQMAGALDAAHALGVIHRDIKPANIMLIAADSRQPRAVITDFGLARVDGPDALRGLSGISSKSNPIGTLAYMAPEQMSGALVSPATDVYAFGLVLFEMATGQRAFPTESLLSGITQRLAGVPPDPATIVPGLPRSWRNAIEGCLVVAPERRFPSAARALAVLEGQASIKLATHDGKRFTAANLRTWLTPPRFAALTLALLAAVALFWAGLRYEGRMASAKVAPGALVYLAPVKNETSEKAFDNLTELIQAGLSQSAQINLLDESRVGDTLQLMTKAPDTVIDEPIAREIAMRTGAARVVFATVTGSAGSYRLDIEIQQPDNESAIIRERWDRSFSWQSSGETDLNGKFPAKLLTALRTASDWTRQQIGESSSDIARLDVPPEDVTTGNWNALNEFVSAEHMQARQLSGDAIVALQNAVHLDPQFALAWARLGDLSVGVGSYEAGFRAYDKALELDQKNRLTRRERDRIKGAYASDSGDFFTAEESYRDYSLYYESDYKPWFYRAYPLRMLGRTDEAIASLERAHAIDPARENAPFELVRSNITKGDYQEALRWVSIIESQGDRANADYFRGVIQFLNKDYDHALASIAGVKDSPNFLIRSLGHTLIARFSAEHEDYEAALATLDEGIQQDKAQGNVGMQADKLLAKAYIEANLLEFERSASDIEAGLQLRAGPEQIITASHVLGYSLIKAKGASKLRLHNLLATLQARMPKEDFGVITRLANAHIKGEILLADGNWNSAIEEFRNASELDAPINPREYLGRALQVAAEHTHDPAHAASLRKEAMDAYSLAALHPNVAWMQDNDDPPGSCGDQLEAYLRLAIATNQWGPATDSKLRDFSKLRMKTFLSSPEMQRALLQREQGSPTPQKGE